MKKKRELPQPTKADILKGIRAYETRDLTRDAMYRVAKEYLQESWGDPGKIADSLGVVLLTWNQPFYRFGVFSFAALEKCISKNLHLIKSFRDRDISSLNMKDKDSIHCLFDELNKALQIAQKDSKAKGRKSPVAVAKALHLLAPNFFPIWDGKIAAAYGYSSGKTAVENYIIFCEKIKRVAKNVCDGIQRKDKPLLKFIDEYNYAKYTKKWIK